jgi:hypothetical protein
MDAPRTMVSPAVNEIKWNRTEDYGRLGDRRAIDAGGGFEGEDDIVGAGSEVRAGVKEDLHRCRGKRWCMARTGTVL